MLGVLSNKLIEQMLLSEFLGRLGCSLDGKIHIVPVNYGYDGKYVYAHSKEGLKIQIMRENKDVCFEIDRLESTGNWKSVILWGKYEELKTVKEQNDAMKIFSNQMARLIPNNSIIPSHGVSKGPGKKNDPFKEVVFRILIEEKSGRFEKKDDK